MSPFQHVTIRVDTATADRFRALATKVHKPLADILRTASYLGYDDLLEFHARRAIAEQPKEAR